MIFWLRGPLDEEAGWASAHSVPHRLSLVDDRLVTEPHPSVHERISAFESDTAGGRPELLSWEPSRGEVQISSEAGLLATLREHEGGVEVVEGTDRHLLPGATAQSVMLLVDGPVLEVFLGTSSYAIGARSDLTVRFAGAHRS